VTFIEIGTVSVTVVALLGLALMLGSLFRSLARSEKLAAVGALAGSIGHELRNPLAAVRNASHYVERRIAKSDLNADERVREFMGIIDKELVACNKIVADLLDYARERPLAIGPSPLRPLVADALSIVQPPRPMRVENDVPEGLPVFDLDPDLMRQVIVNLVQNATEAIPAEREGEVRVTAQVIDETLCVSVTDNGGGIPLGTRRRMFEPLFTTKVKGTGLGLAICAKIVDRHGGAIDVDSTENKGSTVTVRLPRSGRKR
jgi:signal transduction histidine kinase